MIEKLTPRPRMSHCDEILAIQDLRCHVDRILDKLNEVVKVVNSIDFDLRINTLTDEEFCKFREEL